MITMNASDLRHLADALDAMADIERTTGVLIEGHGGNTLTTPSADTVAFERVTEGDAQLVEYVIKITEG